MHPSEIKIVDYSYQLDAEKIPKYPLSQRHQSKLLVYKNREISDHSFNEIQQCLQKSTTLVFNDSKVLPVRFYFETETGKRIEVFCLEEIEGNSNSQSATWKCFVGGAAKWKEPFLSKTIDDKNVRVELINKTRDYCEVIFQWNEKLNSMLDVFETFGHIPIPPYLNRPSEEIDNIRYQNVFAHHDGSVAAPTAGLHFTKNILEELKQQGTDIDFVTLHVGAGTFKPVKSETLGGHKMHLERMIVTLDLIDKLIFKITSKQSITAVGTTTLRTLESLFWLGKKIVINPALSDQALNVKQWDPYAEDKECSPEEALTAIKKWLARHEQTTITFSTELLIVPGYQFKLIDCLVTNFHQPNSTLLLLVAAAVGDDWQKIYDHALNNDYRFLSYGDSSLLYIKD